MLDRHVPAGPAMRKVNVNVLLIKAANDSRDPEPTSNFLRVPNGSEYQFMTIMILATDSTFYLAHSDSLHHLSPDETRLRMQTKPCEAAGMTEIDR